MGIFFGGFAKNSSVFWGMPDIPDIYIFFFFGGGGANSRCSVQAYVQEKKWEYTLGCVYSCTDNFLY